jgi:hypothetical protein
MIFQEMESLDTVEAVMAFEEVFGAELPDDDCDRMDSPREVVDWLERHLTKQRLNKQAAAWLRKLAKAHNNPALAEGLDGTWRREQIAAIVREILRQ